MRSILLSILLLSACSSLVPSTLVQLGAINPLEADPADLAVSIDLPEGVGIRPSSVLMSFAVGRSDTKQVEEEVFTLAELNGIYAVAPGDYPRLRAVQTTARQWKSEAPEATQGSISVGLGPCAIGAGPSDDARVNVAIRAVEGGAFLPLVVNAPTFAVASADEIAAMGPCP